MDSKEGVDLLNERTTTAHNRLSFSSEVERKTRTVEFLEAVMDSMAFAADGELWEKNALGVRLNSDKEVFLHGTFINFIPVASSVEENWSGMFTFSKAREDPSVLASIFVEGGRGHKEGTALRTFNYSLGDVTEDQINTGLEYFAIDLNNTMKTV